MVPHQNPTETKKQLRRSPWVNPVCSEVFGVHHFLAFMGLDQQQSYMTYTTLRLYSLGFMVLAGFFVELKPERCLKRSHHADTYHDLLGGSFEDPITVLGAFRKILIASQQTEKVLLERKNPTLHGTPKRPHKDFPTLQIGNGNGPKPPNMQSRHTIVLHTLGGPRYCRLRDPNPKP